MTLPRLMIVTQQNLMRPNFLSALSQALEGGARLIQLREKETVPAELLDLSLQVKKICDAYGAQLLVNGNLKLAQKIGAGLHLPEADSVPAARRALGREYSIGQSVHSLEAAHRAECNGADYVVFGSVFATASHAGSTPQGVETLRKIASEIWIPVFAIGGISYDNCENCMDADAHGVAVMRGVWQSPNITESVRNLNSILKV